MERIEVCATGADVYRWLAYRIPHAEHIRIASAYLDVRGLESLRDFLGTVFRKSSNAKCLLLWASPTDHREDLKLLELIKSIESKYKGHFFCRRIAGTQGHLFHPKIVLADNTIGQIWVLVGSANLTGPGLRDNTEACIGYDSPGGWCESLYDTFDKWWNESEQNPQFSFDTRQLDRPPPPPPLPQPPLLKKVKEALSKSILIELRIDLRAATLRLPSEFLGLGQRSAFQGEVLSYSDDSRLALDVIPSSIKAELNNLRSWSFRRIRRFTLSTPWGRLIPPNCLHRLKREKAVIDTRIESCLNKAGELNNPELRKGSVEKAKEEFHRLWGNLHNGAEPDSQLIMEVGDRFEKSLSLMQFNPRLRLTPATIAAPASGNVEFGAWIDESQELDMKQFLIKAASVPRRSLMKHHRPDIAHDLCLLPDSWIEQAVKHDWQAQHKPGTLDQARLDDCRTLREMNDILAAQVEAIHKWDSLPLPEVLVCYETLLDGGEITSGSG